MSLSILNLGGAFAFGQVLCGCKNTYTHRRSNKPSQCPYLTGMKLHQGELTDFQEALRIFTVEVEPLRLYGLLKTEEVMTILMPTWKYGAWEPPIPGPVHAFSESCNFSANTHQNCTANLPTRAPS